VDLRAGLDDLEKRKFLTPPGLELDFSVVQPVASRYTDLEKSRNEKHNLYASPSVFRMIKSKSMKLTGHIAGTSRILVAKPEGKRTLGRTRHRLEDNIKMDPGEIVWSAVNWIHLVEDRDQWRALANMVLNFRVP
jgi:hypothetical protein